MDEPLLKIRNLNIAIGLEELIKDFHFEVTAGRIVALVGTSGSGKTTLGLSILRLLPDIMTITGGPILFRDRDLLRLSESEMRQVRGKEIGMVFQEPLSALNPVLTIGCQMEEILKFHSESSPRNRKQKTEELLRRVGIEEPQRIIKSYPHQLSGGLRQRAMIACAICTNPALIIADEPTSNLDVTLQANILELFQHLREEFKLTILLITHDLGVVKHLTDDVAILFEGRIVESGKTKEILSHARHPFTRELLESTML